MLGLSTRSYSVTIDSVRQKIYLLMNRSLFAKTGTPREISFEEIDQIYLHHWEDVYTIADEYGSVERIKRRWSIALALKGGEIVTVNEETTDHRAGETTVLAQQQVRWMSLAQSVAELVGRPLTLDPAISGPPRTFVQAIDRIVQRRVKQLGPKNLSVNIRGSKDLGVEIVVNGKSYAAVDEVEDESVRSLIQASIYEWQDRDK